MMRAAAGKDGGEDGVVQRREQGDLHSVRDARLELPQQECDDLVESHPPAVPIATTIVGTSGDGDTMYCRAIPTVYPSSVKVSAVIPLG